MNDIGIEKSGNLHLVSKDGHGILVDPTTGWQGKTAPVDAILKHCNAQDEWQNIDYQSVHPVVKKVADSFR